MISLSHKVRFVKYFLVAEETGLEPAHRLLDERISNPWQYLLCLLLRVAEQVGFEPTQHITVF